MIVFFFFKQKTADEMRISDWSSDVCSSDLPAAPFTSAGSKPGTATPPAPSSARRSSFRARRLGSRVCRSSGNRIQGDGPGQLFSPPSLLVRRKISLHLIGRSPQLHARAGHVSQYRPALPPQSRLHPSHLPPLLRHS